MVGQSDQLILEDFQDPESRSDLLGDLDLEGVTIFSLRMQDGDDASCRNLYQSSRPRLIGITDAFLAGADRFGEMEWAGVGPKPPKTSNWHVLSDDAPHEDATIPVVLDKNTAMYSLKLFGGVGEEFEKDYGPAGVLKFRVVGLLAGSIFQGSLLVRESDLLKHFHRVGGYRYFLVDAPAARARQVARDLEEALSDQGLDLTDTTRLLTELLAVQNTYLSTFQSLGGLGLLLGTFGLAAVQLRNVVQRRAELALMQATGFRNDQLTMLLLCEHAQLLLVGLVVGIVAALVVVGPHLVFGGAAIPFGSLVATLGLVALVGLASGLVAQRSLSRAALLPALRGD